MGWMRLGKVHIGLLIGLLLLAGIQPSYALSYNHCVLHDSSKCSGANTTSKAITNTERTAAPPSWSAQGGNGPSQFAIDFNNTCRWIDGVGSNTTDFFIPFKTDKEWQNFVASMTASGSQLSKSFTLTSCSRPGWVVLPPNDPQNGDWNTICYDQYGNKQGGGITYFIPTYGRAGDQPTIQPNGINFTCYTAQGVGPWTKTVTAAKLNGYNADRNPGGSSISSSNSDWDIISVSYRAQPINGSCGSTVNGQNLSSAPSGSELCSAGAPSSVGGSGPWSWSCQGINSGADSGCQANRNDPVCPPVTGWVNPNARATWPVQGGNAFLAFTGVTGFIDIHATSIGDGAAGYFNGACTYSYDFQTGAETVNFNGTIYQGSGRQGGLSLANPTYYAFIQCIATEYARENLSGYGHCTPNSVSGNAASPIKVNLSGGDAKMNSATPTAFYLTLQDHRILEGHVTGGLNADEGWLMVHRSSEPLVYPNGVLNANDWFGDRDHRSVNGYTDLAETFKDFVTKDEYGKRFIPLHQLSNDERKSKVADASTGKIINPSVDLRVLDAAFDEHFASDYFDRIYVDYRDVVEDDGPDGKGGNNIILERGMVRTLAGENHGAIDQWFILDIPSDYSAPDHPTQSKVWPAPTK